MSKLAFGLITTASVLGGLLVLFAQSNPNESSGPAPIERTSTTVEPYRPPALARVTRRATSAPLVVSGGVGHAPTPMKPDAGALLDETELLEKLHDLGGEDPPLSLKLAREALGRYPASPNAPEFRWNIVKALYNMGRFDEASEEGRMMLDAYPDSSFTIDVDRHLLHPLPNPE